MRRGQASGVKPGYDGLMAFLGERIFRRFQGNLQPVNIGGKEKQLIDEVLLTLRQRERIAVRLRFALDGGEPKTFSGIASEWGVSTERARQFFTKAMRKLQHPSRRKQLRLLTVQGLQEALGEGCRKIQFLEGRLRDSSDLLGQADLRIEFLKNPIEFLDLSVRAYLCLKEANILTVRQLVQLSESEALGIKSFSRRSLSEIRYVLGDLGLSFGMKFDEKGRILWTPP